MAEPMKAAERLMNAAGAKLEETVKVLDGQTDFGPRSLSQGLKSKIAFAQVSSTMMGAQDELDRAEGIMRASASSRGEYEALIKKCALTAESLTKKKLEDIYMTGLVAQPAAESWR